MCVWETDEMAKNETALKMKRDKKQRENLGLGGGQFEGLLRQVIDTAISKLKATKTGLLRRVIDPPL